MILGPVDFELKLKVVAQPFDLGVNPKIGLGGKGEDDEKPDEELGFLNRKASGPRLHPYETLDEPQPNRTAEVGRGQLDNKTKP